MKFAWIALGLVLVPSTASAANVLVISNQHQDSIVADFTVNTSHTLTAWNANVTPTLEELQEFEVVLLAEDGVFGNAVNIGNVLAEYYENGGHIVAGTFYLQDRSDAGFGGSWGALEQYDPFTGVAGGCEYNADDMDAASIVDHPITAGVNTLSAASFRGGATAKVDTTVLALWETTNPNGLPDPVIGIRSDANNCIVGITVIPFLADFPGEVTGDFYTLWDNALAWAATCAPPGPCHNGMLDEGEECDDGNFQNGDACVGQCLDASCGDGYVQVGVEPCDDGDDDNEDNCLVGCIAPSCGDGFLQAGVEACDDANDDDTDTCVGSTCQLASCGDGFVFAGFEECDDGNDQAGDGCTACQLDSSESSSEGGESSSEGGESSTEGVETTSTESSSGGGDTTNATNVDETGTDGGSMTMSGGESSSGGDTTGTSSASASVSEDSSGGSGSADGSGGGCGCTSAANPQTPWMLLGLAAIGMRRRRGRALLVAMLAACGTKAAESGESGTDADGSSGAQIRCGGAPGNCEMFSPCESCGSVASAFDVDGCLRAQCASDAECSAGERCYVGAQFDVCLSAPSACVDDLQSMTCSCTPGPECSASGFCVPEHQYPSLGAGPEGVAVIERSCGPDDGVLTILRIHAPGTVVECAAPPTDVDPILELVFDASAVDGVYSFSGTMANGSGTFTDSGGTLAVRAASLTVADISAATTDGSYTYVVNDAGGVSQYGGSFTAAPSCPIAEPCG